MVRELFLKIPIFVKIMIINIKAKIRPISAFKKLGIDPRLH